MCGEQNSTDAPHLFYFDFYTGSILKEQGKLEEALAHYHEAVTIDPLFSDGYR